jgi:trimethylamine--corrinoid protein Co-methyltransferase
VGANLVHDVGYVESGLTCSYEMIVLGDEMIGMVRRLLEGIQITPETLALDAIQNVGPGGDFITAPHTTEHYRSVWYPRILDRRAYKSWFGAGKTTATERARNVARETIEQHQPDRLSENMLANLHAIVDEADARLE